MSPASSIRRSPRSGWVTMHHSVPRHELVAQSNQLGVSRLMACFLRYSDDNAHIRTYMLRAKDACIRLEGRHYRWYSVSNEPPAIPWRHSCRISTTKRRPTPYSWHTILIPADATLRSTIYL